MHNHKNCKEPPTDLPPLNHAEANSYQYRDQLLTAKHLNKHGQMHRVILSNGGFNVGLNTFPITFRRSLDLRAAMNTTKGILGLPVLKDCKIHNKAWLLFQCSTAGLPATYIAHLKSLIGICKRGRQPGAYKVRSLLLFTPGVGWKGMGWEGGVVGRSV